MKIKKARLTTSVLFFFIAGTFLGFGLSDDRALGFELPLPLSVTNIENPDIFCYTKITTDVIDEDGKIIASEQSAFFKGNPITTFSFVDTVKEQSVSGFKVTPKIKCNTPDTSDPFDFGQVPVVINDNDMVLKVFSKSADGTYLIETFNAKITTNEIKLTNNQEQSLGSFTINSDDILKFVESGNYDSTQHIVLEGDFLIHWDGYPSVVYALTAGTNKQHDSEGRINSIESSLITYREITIDSSGAGVGEKKECGTGEFEKSGVCVKVTGGSSSNPNIIPTSTDIFSQFGQCVINNPDKSCLASSQFSPFYLGGVGLLALGFASKREPRQMVYGVEQ